MARVSINDILELPTLERMELVQQIWDSIAAHPDSVSVPEWQKRELDHRLEAIEKNPTAGESWENLKNSLRRE